MTAGEVMFILVYLQDLSYRFPFFFLPDKMSEKSRIECVTNSNGRSLQDSDLLLLYNNVWKQPTKILKCAAVHFILCR